MTAYNRSEVARRDPRRAASFVQAVLTGLLVSCLGLVGAPAAAADPASVQAQQWWIERLGLQQAWQISKGAGVTVAVLDTGVDAGFGDLAGGVVPGFVPGGSGDGRVDTDPAIHGTRMADNIAGRGTGFGLLGVAPQAKILPVVLRLGTGALDTMVEALNRLSAMPHPPQVVNISVNAAGDCPTELQGAVRTAVGKGMILVASAGNEGNTANESMVPGNCAGVVAVGAYSQDLTAWPKSERQPYVGLAGPGVHMVGFYQKTGGIGYADGTSDAAAIVSGSFALVRAHFPTMPSRQLVARVLATARQFQGAQGSRNDVWGYGAARPHHALTDSVPASAPNPIYDALDKLDGPPTTTSSGPASSEPTGAPSRPHTAAAVPGSSQANRNTDNDSTTGVLVAIAVAVFLVMLIVIGLVLRSRRSRPAEYPPPPGYGPPRP
jgi:hypothetical protein